MAKLSANSGDPDQMSHSATSGSTLFAIYAFFFLWGGGGGGGGMGVVSRQKSVNTCHA